jgi:hypothetical protein
LAHLSPLTASSPGADIVSAMTNGGEHRDLVDTHRDSRLPDYTLTLSRLPDGVYIGLASLTHYSDREVATGSATIFDHPGAIGSCVATALANPGVRLPF